MKHTLTITIIATLLTFVTAPGLVAQSLPETVVTATSEPAPVTTYQSPAPAPAVQTPAPAPVQEPTPTPVVEVSEPELTFQPLVPARVDSFRTGTPLVDIPRSLTVFPEQRIDDQAISSVSEIVDYTPGVNNSQGEGHRDAVVFRGTDRSTSDFYLDGIRDDVQYYRSLYNIEQVEILRGPSALHFGRGGVGGVINRVSKKPVLGETVYTPKGSSYLNNDFFDWGVGVDTFGATNVEFDWNSALSESSAFRLNGFYDYLNNHRDFYTGNRFGINPTYAIQINPDTRVDLSYEYNNHERFIDRGIPSSNGRPATNLSETVFGDEDLNSTEFESHVFRASLDHQFNDAWEGRVVASYGNYDKTYQNFFAAGYDPATDTVTIDGYIDSTQRQSFNLAADLIGEFNTGKVDHKLFVGSQYSSTSSDQFRFNNVWDTNGDDQEDFIATGFRLFNGSAINSAGNLATSSFSDLNDDTRVDIDTYSFVIQDEISFNEKLDLVLGARFDSFDIDVLNAANGTLASRTDREISPRIGVVYQPTDNLSLYASYSESFLPRSGDQFANLGNGGNTLDPNIASNLEFGVNWAADDDLYIRAAIFQIEQSLAEEIGNTDVFVGVDTEIEGAEVELTGYLNPNWFLTAGYTFLDADVIDENGDTGRRPREVPAHTFSFWNRVDVSSKLGLGLGMIFQDDTFANSNNEVLLPDFYRVDAAAYYQLSEKTRLQVNIENLFDTEYFPSAHSNNNISVGRPLNATFSIKSRF